MAAITAEIELAAFTNLLSSKKVLEIKEPFWNYIKIYHGVSYKQHYQVSNYPEMRKHFDSLKMVAAVYAYFYEGQCLYIGIAKDLRERIYQHLLESCDVWGHLRYRATFTKYHGPIDFYYLPLGDQGREGNYLRSIVEKILQAKHKPLLKSIKL